MAVSSPVWGRRESCYSMAVFAREGQGMNRRTFILAAGAGIAASRAAGANDRVNVAVIGLRGRGREHVGIFGSQPDSTVAAVVDIDDSMSERAVAQAEKVQNSKPKSYRDLRRMLEDKNIDAVSIA